MLSTFLTFTYFFKEYVNYATCFSPKREVTTNFRSIRSFTQIWDDFYYLDICQYSRYFDIA